MLESKVRKPRDGIARGELVEMPDRSSGHSSIHSIAEVENSSGNRGLFSISTICTSMELSVEKEAISGFPWRFMWAIYGLDSSNEI